MKGRFVAVSSGKPVEPTEIYPGTKCNAVPFVVVFIFYFSPVCVPVYCFVFMHHRAAQVV